MTKMEEFDIRFELENAARENSFAVKADRVWSLAPAGFQTTGYGFIVPAVWRFHGRFVAGFEMDDGRCIRFIDHATQSENEAIVAAPRLTGLVYEVDADLR